MSIGQNIKLFRQSSHMTLEEVAQRIGISRQTMSRYETGVISNIPSDKIEALSTIFGTTPASLMGWSEIENYKKTAAPKSDGLSPYDAQLMDYLRLLTDDQKRFLLAQIKTLLSTQE